eukprot:Sspe_Gene.20627::Locus_7586_Transcript_1_1_Confidence_1.000_Length_3772::g.20627::m.20627
MTKNGRAARPTTTRTNQASQTLHPWPATGRVLGRRAEAALLVSSTVDFRCGSVGAGSSGSMHHLATCWKDLMAEFRPWDTARLLHLSPAHLDEAPQCSI